MFWDSWTPHPRPTAPRALAECFRSLFKNTGPVHVSSHETVTRVVPHGDRLLSPSPREHLRVAGTGHLMGTAGLSQPEDCFEDENVVSYLA